MSKTLLFIAILSILQTKFRFASAACDCRNETTYLRCSLDTFNDFNTADCGPLSTIKYIELTYNNQENANINIQMNIPIIIKPVNPSSSKLRISSLNTSASKIEINYRVDANNIGQTIFPVTNLILPSNLTLNVNIDQRVSSLTGFSIFPNSAHTVLNDYSVVVNTSLTGILALDYSNILTGVSSLASLSISGSKHTFTENPAASTCVIYTSLLKLRLSNLILNERVLNCFPNITYYTVEQCDYNGIAFLTSQYNYTSSVKMISNNPTNTNIEFSNAFQNFVGLPEVTIIEPKINSSILRGLTEKKFNYLFLELNSYRKSDFEQLISSKPSPFSVTINNLFNLDVIPSGFFNTFDRITDIRLSGEFELKSDAICAFVAVNTFFESKYTQINLSPKRQSTDTWDLCALTYINAINWYSRNMIRCIPSNSLRDCRNWASAVEKCNFTGYENGKCSISYPRDGVFRYNVSSLNKYFQGLLLNQTETDTKDEEESGPSRIIPVIIALCALLVAITVLIITIFFVRRQRQNQRNTHLIGVPTGVDKEGPPPNYHDLSHISIATTRTIDSMYPKLDPSVFPPANPTVQIAPPLYTAPSENFPLSDNLKQQSASSGGKQRASVMTSNTHVYETLDP